MQVFNWGMEGYAWVMVLVYMILILLAGGAIWNGFKVVKTKTKRKKKIYATRSIAISVVWFMIVIFVFFSYGSGRHVQVTPAEDEGMKQMIEQMPNEKGKEVIEKEAYDDKPESLKRQDQGFGKEAKEADEYIKKSLETYGKEE